MLMHVWQPAQGCALQAFKDRLSDCRGRQGDVPSYIGCDIKCWIVGRGVHRGSALELAKEPLSASIRVGSGSSPAMARLRPLLALLSLIIIQVTLQASLNAPRLTRKQAQGHPVWLVQSLGNQTAIVADRFISDPTHAPSPAQNEAWCSCLLTASSALASHLWEVQHFSNLFANGVEPICGC